MKPTTEVDNFIDLLKANAKIEALTGQLTEVMLSASNALQAEEKKNAALMKALEEIYCANLNDVFTIARKAIENND